MNKLNNIIAFLVVLSILLFPDFRLGEGMPALQFIDFLVPIIFVLVCANWKKIVWKKIYSFLIIFSGYIIVTIVANDRLGMIKDYFEIYKVLKFLLIIIFFSIVKINNFKTNFLYPIFALLVIFNLGHYFNVLGINELIETYYNGGIHLEFFGMDSLGRLSTKRMIGVIGNPNTNAIVFLIFIVLFYPKDRKINLSKLPFFMALVLFFLCQSRTGFGALLIVVLFQLLYCTISKGGFKLKNINFLPLLMVVVSFSISYLFSANIIKTDVYNYDVTKIKTIDELVKTEQSTYINSVFSGDVTQTNSVKGRLKIWKHLWGMVEHKPILGHAPSKEYFYENKLYAENEYILYLWRYGAIGLLFYLALIGSLFWLGFKNRYSDYALALMLLSIIVAITAITNTPLNSREILIFIGVVIGLFFNSLKTTIDEL